MSTFQDPRDCPNRLAIIDRINESFLALRQTENPKLRRQLVAKIEAARKEMKGVTPPRGVGRRT